MNNRYYYHWLLDTDNNPATGRSNAEYEGNPTGVQNPIGAERIIMIGWRDGEPNGVEVYDPLNEDVPLLEDFEFQHDGDSVEARVPLDVLDVAVGQTVALSAFQEGSSDGWATDWMESVSFTLQAGGGDTLTLEALFAGNPYGFRIEVTDEGDGIVDPATVTVQSDGTPVAATVIKEGGITTIVGRHPALLPPDTVHTVRLALTAGGVPQTKEFVFKVNPYTVLPLETRFASLDESNRGFVAQVSQISNFQTQEADVHHNEAGLAEKQQAGEMKDSNTNLPYYNEVEEEFTKWQITPVVVEDVVNWYELAPGESASMNFPDDQPFPKLDRLPAWGLPVEGDVIEILTYLKLKAGFHQLGLYTEGGHKVTAGFNPDDPLLSLFDNSDGVDRVPTYFARNQFFDLVAPEDGYYPVRWLWFQNHKHKEKGLILELFSVENRELHLLNKADDPLSLKAFRAGVLLDPDFVMPTLNITRDGANVIVRWTGILQVSESVTGPWEDFADDSKSPLTFPTELPAAFARARSK